MQAKTRQNIADEYGISTKTLSRWLKKHQINLIGRDRICPMVVEEIYLKLGCPIMSDNVPKSPKMSDTTNQGNG
jgi:abortive infection bacteriophage resistance protein